MKLSELAAVAIEAMRRHRLRSVLTLSGVVMGVATVVSVISVIRGLNAYVGERVLNLNPDVLVFTRMGIIRNRLELVIARKRKPMTLAEARVIERECRTCGAVGASATHMDAVHAGRRRLADVQIQGNTANLASMVRMDLESGRTFTPAEEEHAAPVAVIGADVRERLFPTQDAIGQVLYVRGFPVRVVGVQARQGNFLGQNRDGVVITPVTFLEKILTARDEVSIYVRPRAGLAGLDAAQDEVRSLLRSIRRTAFQADDPFGVMGAEAVQSLWGTLTTGAFALLVVISLISLVVGAIVIANILYVSVVERTLEIGIRMAVGARRRDIRLQFLIEAVLLAGVGGTAGVVLGWAVALLVGRVFPADLSVGVAASGIALAVVAGLAAGIAPAAAAARIPPVEALRYE
jgi:putative ABC transport system permease protein